MSKHTDQLRTPGSNNKCVFGFVDFHLGPGLPFERKLKSLNCWHGIMSLYDFYYYYYTKTAKLFTTMASIQYITVSSISHRHVTAH
jgi:hypothetical protein